MNIKKGDQVKVISGKDKGKTGAIIRILPKENKLTIEGVNLYKKRMKPKTQGQKGEIVLVARPLFLSKVKLICQSCKNAVRVGWRFESGRKTRYCKKCGAKI